MRGAPQRSDKMAASALGWALRAARQVSAAPSRPCSPQGPAKALGEQVLPLPRTWQVRSYYVDWRMLRDVKRRKLAYEYADERLRINAIRKNTILPKELQEVADKEIANLPRDSCPVRIQNRCVLTSRPRGVKRRWRLSRIVFRHFADHAQMSGIQRAMW